MDLSAVDVAVLLVLAVVVSPPVLLFWGLLGSNALTALMFATEVALLSTYMGDFKDGMFAAVAFVLLTPVSIVAGTDPLAAACLMAVI